MFEAFKLWSKYISQISTRNEIYQSNIPANKSLLVMSLNILLLEKVVTAKCTYPCKGLYNCPGRHIPLTCNTYKNKNQISNLRIHEEE